MSEALLGSALKKGIIELEIRNPRDFVSDKHLTVDDRPYGGGPGMVMMASPLLAALNSFPEGWTRDEVVLLSPGGYRFDQPLAKSITKLEEIIFVCGRYEGIDQRFIDKYCTSQISVGDYVLMGGELPALVILETVTRLLPGVLGNKNSFLDDSFYSGDLSYPAFTRPEQFEDMTVPKVLLSGNHKRIEEAREEWSKARSKRQNLLSLKLEELLSEIN